MINAESEMRLLGGAVKPICQKGMNKAWSLVSEVQLPLRTIYLTLVYR